MRSSRDLEDRTVSAVSRAGRKGGLFLAGKAAAAVGASLGKLTLLAAKKLFLMGKKLLMLAAKAALAALKALAAALGPVVAVVIGVLALGGAIVSCLPGGDPDAGGKGFVFRELYETAAHRAFPLKAYEYRADHSLPWAAVWAVHVAVSPGGDEDLIPRVAGLLAPRFEWFESSVVTGLPDGVVFEDPRWLVASVDGWDGRWEYRYRRERANLVDGSWREQDVLAGRFYFRSASRIAEALAELLGRPVPYEYAELVSGAAAAVRDGRSEDPRLEEFLLRAGDF